jgi:hypothetical protein
MDDEMIRKENAMSLDTEGSEISANENSEAGASPMHKEKQRRCLVCCEDFVSAWAGERVCKKCRSSTAWRQG